MMSPEKERTQKGSKRVKTRANNAPEQILWLPAAHIKAPAAGVGGSGMGRAMD
jgi:hypothetical protein